MSVDHEIARDPAGTANFGDHRELVGTLGAPGTPFVTRSSASAALGDRAGTGGDGEGSALGGLVATVADLRAGGSPRLSPKGPQRTDALQESVRRVSPVSPLSPPDWYCWPFTEAMNGEEIARFEKRLMRFNAMGLSQEQAEEVADKLLRRDRDADDRRVCLECTYLGTSGICHAAATRRLPGAPAVYQPIPTLLQRCNGFGLKKGLA